MYHNSYVTAAVRQIWTCFDFNATETHGWFNKKKKKKRKTRKEKREATSYVIQSWTEVVENVQGYSA